MAFIMARTNKLFIILLSMFTTSIQGNSQERNPLTLFQIVNETMRSVAKVLEKDFDLTFVGSGGRMINDVEEIEVMFIAYRKGSIEEARVLEVNTTQRLLEALNKCEKIRPYLKEYPSNASRLNVSISFNKLDNSSFSDGSVAHVLLTKNRIHYLREDSLTERRVTMLTEPYEDAVNILKKQSKK